MKRFERKLQLFHFFKDKEEDDDDEEYVRLAFEENPNYWPKKLNKNITELCREVKKEIHNLYKQSSNYYNLSKAEIKALNELKRNQNIIIKKADKNSGLVVMNKKDYETKVYTQLRDIKVYTPLKEDDSQNVKIKSDKLLKTLLDNNSITDKQYHNLTNYSVKPPIFYGIPKIHKKNNPLRPIVSQINGPTYKLNQYIHELLLVAESEIPYLFKDTTAFLQLIEHHKEVNNNTILVTMDVVSLYTNIPHQEAIKFVTEHYEDTLQHWHLYDTKVLKIKPDFLRQLLDLMLSNCTLEFNQEYYSQNYGTPMGAPASVRIANIFMYKFLLAFLNSYTGHIPPFIGRLIDDLFFIWHKDTEELFYFYEQLNKFHNTIKFEITYSTSKVNFLDTTVYIENGLIKTTLYTKPTDRKQYLSYHSCHPKHIMKAIPYSQALRYRRIITEDEILLTELNSLLQKFTIRGYPLKETKMQIFKVCDLKRLDTLQYKTSLQKREDFKKFTKGGAFLPLILTYRPEYVFNTYNLHKALSVIWNNYIQKDEEFKNTFGNSIPKIVFKKGQNISNILIRAKYNDTEVDNSHTETLITCLAELAAESSLEYCITKCGVKRCKLCAVIHEGPTFQSSTTLITYYIAENMSCYSRNTIYLITCTKCNIQYVGESGRTLRERFNNHRSDITLKKNTATSKHFNEILHEYKHLKVTPLEIIIDPNERKDKEGYWIKTLNTRYPQGLNYYPL